MDICSNRGSCSGTPSRPTTCSGRPANNNSNNDNNGNNKDDDADDDDDNDNTNNDINDICIYTLINPLNIYHSS